MKRYVALTALLAVLAACGSSSKAKGLPAAQQQAKACSAKDAQQAYNVLFKAESDFDAQVALSNLDQMQTLRRQLLAQTLPACATTANNALQKYMSDQIQRLSGTPSAALTNDVDLYESIAQNELTIMVADTTPRR